MAFGYWDYLTNNLLLPVFGLVFIAVPVVRLVIRLLEQYATGRSRVNWDGRAIFLFVAMLLVGVMLAGNLVTGGGLHLITERPKDAVTVEGTLELVEPYSIWTGIRYTSNGESSSGYKYVVNGQTLTGMARGTLEAGDEVSVTYLPKSGFVLSIEEQ